jgi:hypothetical protein
MTDKHDKPDAHEALRTNKGDISALPALRPYLARTKLTSGFSSRKKF